MFHRNGKKVSTGWKDPGAVVLAGNPGGGGRILIASAKTAPANGLIRRLDFDRF